MRWIAAFVVVLAGCGAPRAPATGVGGGSSALPPVDAGVAMAVDAGAPGTWREVKRPPEKLVTKLSQREETAPGRTDSAGQISGYCPPKAVVFDLGGGRALVTREPCSGVTEISIRDRKTKTEVRVADSMLYGVVGKWEVVPIDRDRLVMISQGTRMNLQVVELGAARARWVRLPNDLEQGTGQRVGVADGQVFVWGGTLQVAIGAEGCENPPPNQGCDPVAITKAVPNPKVWALTP